MSSQPTLAAHGIVKRFGGVAAVDGVTLELHAGSVTGLIGANGAGKSTLINVLSGNYKPDGGSVFLEGRDVTKSSGHSRAKAGLSRTFQHPRLVPTLTCFENVLLGAEVPRAGWRDVVAFAHLARRDRDSAARAAAALRQLRVPEAKWSRRPNQLAPADWLWTEIARALAADPKVLLLDEPSTGFTGAENAELIAALNRLRQRSRAAVLLVTHDVTLAMRVADTMVVMHHGERIAAGAPDVIANDPQVISSYLGKRGHDMALAVLAHDVEHDRTSVGAGRT